MRALIKIYKHTIFLMIVTLLLLVSVWMDTVIETIFLFTSFLVWKQKYRFKYHCKSAFQCFFVSVGVFVLAMRISLPVGWSYTFSGLCGVFIAYIAQHVAETKFIREDYAYIEPRYNILIEQQKHFDIYSLGEEELRVYCRGKGLDLIDEEIVTHRIIHRLRGKGLYDRIGYSKPQMIRREKRIESVLGIKLK